jgi:hypothetical protein
MLKSLAGALILLALFLFQTLHARVLLTDILVFALFAVDLQFIMARRDILRRTAYFGLRLCRRAAVQTRSADGAALALAPLGGNLAALILAGSVRLSGVSRHAHPRLRADRLVARVSMDAFARWLERTGRPPAPWLINDAFLSCAGAGAGGILLLWRCVYSPSATRCAPAATRRCAPCHRHRRALALMAGLRAGGCIRRQAGRCHAFSKGSISPDTQ